MTLTVRTARLEDRPSIGRMINEFMDYLDAIEPFERADGLTDALLDLSFGPDPVCVTLIAERNGEPLGYLGYHLGVWEIFRSLHVISLFVRTEARGSGAGRALMDAAKEVARRHRATRVVWEVWNRNPGALAFYRAIGGEIYEDNVRMSLAVD